MPNGGLIAGFLNLANPINQIPMLLAGKMCATDCGILKEMLLKEPETEHEKKNPHNDDCSYFFKRYVSFFSQSPIRCVNRFPAIFGSGELLDENGNQQYQDHS